MKYHHVFEPGKIGKLEIKNRIVMPAMGTNFAEADGSLGGRAVHYYAARARGGTGLITVETCAVTPAGGRAVACSVSLHDGKFLPGMRDLTDAVHAYGAKVSIQLSHTGRQSTMMANSNQVPVAPSAIACPLVSCYDIGVVPVELTREGIQDIIDGFAAAAGRAMVAGFDAVELHGAHGYLINQFLSPVTNHRKDEYGGGFEERLTFARQVIGAVREAVGPDFPIIIRLNAEDHMAGGLVLEDTKKIAAALVEAGIDCISVSSGMYPSLHRVLAPIYTKPAFLMPYCAEIKSTVNVPVIGVGRISNLALADKVLSQQMADFIAIGRAQIAEPEIVNKSKAGRTKEIRNCIYCNFCSMDRLLAYMRVRCAVNAEAGREAEYAIVPASVP
ncbi:MAG: NADH:flavin oxidoreductase, partial [Desulfatitalea sp.]|nr:NADH:flavin oxidoreductase [Desulfatitalea sp.]